MTIEEAMKDFKTRYEKLKEKNMLDQVYKANLTKRDLEKKIKNPAEQQKTN